MKIHSRQFGLGIFAGIAIGVLAVIFVGPNCWSFIMASVTAASLAKVSRPRDGVIVGVIVAPPVGLLAVLRQPPMPAMTQDAFGIFALLLGCTLGLALMGGLGALSGLVLGKLFQITSDRLLIL